MNKKFYTPYLAPEAEVVESIVEAGFAYSTDSNLEDPKVDDSQHWED